jgi:hypothetical protein
MFLITCTIVIIIASSLSVNLSRSSFSMVSSKSVRCVADPKQPHYRPDTPEESSMEHGRLEFVTMPYRLGSKSRFFYWQQPAGARR